MVERNERLAKEKLEADALRKLHRDEDFYYLMNRIMENTVSNLVTEASYGEFEPTRVPRQIVEVVNSPQVEENNGDMFDDTMAY